MGMELPKSFRILDSVGHTPEALQRPNCSAWTLHCACPGQRIALALSLTFADQTEQRRITSFADLLCARGRVGRARSAKPRQMPFSKASGKDSWMASRISRGHGSEQ